MKNLTVLTVFALSILSSNLCAQYVTIPDTAFVTFLSFNYPQCMNGNQMDTTCNAIITAYTVDCRNKNIKDISGIEYFDGLGYLICSDNNIDSLKALPPRLKILAADNNNISYAASFTSNIREILLADNPLSGLPMLPDSLELLNISNCSFTSVPTLVPTITNLNLRDNLIDTITYLPNGLKSLICNGNNVSTLPSLPTTLLQLNCSDNPITSLPSLPDSLKLFDASNIDIDTVPPLPSGLITFDYSSNNLTNLPTLPPSLAYLTVSGNQLTSLPALPSKLVGLNCILNSITSIPELPDSMDYVYINLNPVTCLPALKKINVLNFTNTYVTCLPNYGQVVSSSPPLSSLPLCDPNNTNGCQIYYNFSGQVFFDENTNCLKDGLDTSLAVAKVQLWQNGQLLQQAFTGIEGLYSFDVQNTYGTYSVTLDSSLLPFSIFCPANGQHNNTVSASDSIFDDQNFGLQCKPGFDVGIVDIVRDPDWFRPASYHNVHINAGDIAQIYGANCADGIQGQVKVIMSGPASIQSFGGLAPTLTLGDTAIWDITDFGAISFTNSFNVNIQVDSFAQPGALVCFDVTVNPFTGDNNITNNELANCFEVVSSYDPNNKLVYPLSSIDTTQEWLYYTVNFQNTGNAPALNVTIADTLSSNLDASSIQLLSYSHDNYTQILPGGIIRFNFPDINLPDSTNDEPNSHGYISYKIKLTEGLSVGTTIKNTAHIYFDLNAPIVTNTTVNTIVAPLQQPSIFFSTTDACEGDTVTLETAYDQTYTYSWYFNGNPLNNSNTNTLEVTQAGDYKVRIDNGIQTITSDVEAVSFNPLPSVNIALPTDPFCEGDDLIDLSTYGTPTGGTYSGTAITNGMLDVSTADTYAITYNYTDNNGCVNSKQANATVEVCDGIEELAALGIHVFPNPASNNIWIALTDNTTIQYVKLIDLNGKIVATATTTNNGFNIDVSELPSQNYLLVMINEEGKVVTSSSIQVTH